MRSLADCVKETIENKNSKSKIYSIEEVRNILDNNCNNLAFLLGNGINRYYKNESISWEKLLLDLWNNFSSPDNMQNEIFKGISFTEYYDAIEIQNFRENNFGSRLQKEVKEKMVPWKPDFHQNKILNKIKDYNAPILTTNFDNLIPQSKELDFFKLHSKGFTDYYPWGCYYSDKELSSPVSGFGVWYPNGMMKYHRSIKLGMSQYMGNVERARKMIHNQEEGIFFSGKNQDNWIGSKTWLHILFNKSLFVLGLGLEENEIFMRWLLIERAKYFKMFPERKKDGWYIMSRKNEDENYFGKKFFLESVGLEVIEVENYDVQFDKIWS